MSVCFSLVSPAGEEGQWRDRDEIVQAPVLPKARVGRRRRLGEGLGVGQKFEDTDGDLTLVLVLIC